jgi:dienelactone hydrolase
MAEVLLFHHVLGLTDGVRGFAETLRSAGHVVHTPDLFEGRTFPTIDEGMAHARQVGFDTILDQGVAEAATLGSALVYAGFSMGVMPAQKLAQTRPGARGALLFDSCLPVTEFGERWPDGVPVQVHGMDADPFFAGDGSDETDLAAARQLVASTDQAELFLYPGNVHLFADSSLPGYDAEAAQLLATRVLGFLAALG